jgi:predicted lipid-binding transport protein (Tim44 family)
MDEQLKQEDFDETEPFIDIPQGSFDPVKNIELSTVFIGKLAERNPNRASWMRIMAILCGIGLILGILPPAVVIGIDLGGVAAIILWLLAIIIGVKIIIANSKK